jgi:hypothetical protein
MKHFHDQRVFNPESVVTMLRSRAGTVEELLSVRLFLALQSDVGDHGDGVEGTHAISTQPWHY